MKFESLGTALQYAYPSLAWQLELFSTKGKKSMQRWIRALLEELLPDTEIIEEFHHPELSWGRECFCRTYLC